MALHAADRVIAERIEARPPAGLSGKVPEATIQKSGFG